MEIQFFHVKLLSVQPVYGALNTINIVVQLKRERKKREDNLSILHLMHG